LIPLDDRLGQGRADYFPVMLDTFSCGGRLYGLPKDSSAAIMFYNAEMFEKNGVPAPSAEWKWTDLLRAAKALTRDTNGDGRVDQWGLNAPAWHWFVWQNGGRILDESGRRFALREPAAMEALQFWSDLRNLHGVTPAPETTSDLGGSRLFALQKVAMDFSMYPAVSMFRKQCSFRWNIAHIPGGPRFRATEVCASAMAVTSQSRNQAAAFEFVRWMTLETGMRFLVSVESPSCVSLARSDRFLKSPGLPESKQVAIEVMEYARPPLQHPRYQEIMDVLWAELTKVNLGLATVQEAVDRAAPRVERILQRE
jgi:multiple sugar transport system substrate-binding protein